MLESFLVAGRQELHFGKAEMLAYGQSITDACMSWERTVDALETLAAAITTRRTLVRS
jgi:3-deoxy-7-phosphoheptulonate synthase